MKPLKARAEISLILLLGCVYLLTYSGRLHSVDEVSVLTTAGQLARTGELHVNPIYWMGDAIQVGKIGPDGNLYAKHSLLWAVLSVPWVLVGARLASVGNVQVALLAPLVLTLLTAWVILRAGRRLGWREEAAAGGALAFGLATLAWPYSKYFFSEPLAGFLLAATVYGLIAVETGGGARWWTITGLAAGLAVLAKPANFVLVAPPMGLLLALAWWSRRQDPSTVRRGSIRGLVSGASGIGRAVGLLAPLAACLGLAALANWWRFGDPRDFGYAPTEAFSNPPAAGLWGLLLSPGKGVLWYAPACLVAIAAWARLARRRLRLVTTIGLAMGLYLALMAAWHVWWGGLNWGPRFLVPLMPLVGIGVAAWLACPPKGRPLRLLAWGCLLISLVAQFPAAFTDYVPYEIALYQELGQDWQRSPALADPVRSPLIQQWRWVAAGDLETWWSGGGRLVWSVGVGLAALLAGALLTVALRRRVAVSDRLFGLATLGLAALALGAFVIGQPRQQPVHQDAVTFPALAALQSRLRPGDGVLSLQPLSYPVLTNWYKAPNSLLGLSPEPTAGAAGPPPLDRLVAASDRLWLLIEPERPLAWERGRSQLVEILGRRPFRLAVEQPALLSLASPAPDPPVATFGGQIALVEARADRRPPEEGAGVDVRLIWRAVAPPAADYTAFVHAVGPTGDLLAQHDGPPLGGLLASSEWPAGTEIVDTRSVDLPADAPCRLKVGLYHPVTGERLPPAGTGDPETRTVDLPCADSFTSR